MLSRLAHLIARRRWWVIGIWIALTLFGGFAAGQVSKRWYQSFSIPGKSAYEANQRTLKAFGIGIRPPNVVVFHTASDATKSDAIRAAMQRAAKASPGALTSSYYLDGQPDVRVEGPAHDVHGDLPGGAGDVRHEERRRCDAKGCGRRTAGGHQRPRDRARSARGSQLARLDGRRRACCSKR